MEKARKLPTMQWQSHKWYYDHRLSELKRTDNNHQFVKVDEAQNDMNYFELNILADLILEAE